MELDCFPKNIAGRHHQKNSTVMEKLTRKNAIYFVDNST